MRNICNLICDLVDYALEHGLIEECDRVYATNRILEKLGVSDYAPEAHEKLTELEDILGGICDYAAEQGIDNILILFGEDSDSLLAATTLTKLKFKLK